MLKDIGRPNNINSHKYILGIDTSCDDTCVGIIDYNYKIISNRKITRSYDSFGGVMPEIAARNHLNDIDIALQYALKDANLSINDIDIMSATVGPGLIHGLIVGYYFTYSLAKMINKIFIPIHHIEAHMSVVHIDYPFLALIASGGHTMIIKCQNFLNYKIIANTLDDSAGELFDKIGRKLGFNFPSGIYIEQAAKKSNHSDCLLLPNKGKKDFSFSGLKTAFLRKEDLSKEDLSMLLQNTVGSSFIEKIQIAQKLTNIDKIIFCGGVASNQHIRKQLSMFNIIYPPIELCTDNGVMIACAARNHMLHNSKFINKNIDIFTNINIEQWCSYF